MTTDKECSHDKRAMDSVYTCTACDAEAYEQRDALREQLAAATRRAEEAEADLAKSRAFADAECSARMEAQVELARVQRLPELPWAEVTASIMQRLAKLARVDQPEAKALLDVLDKGKTYVARLLARAEAAEQQRDAKQATRDAAMATLEATRKMEALYRDQRDAMQADLQKARADRDQLAAQLREARARIARLEDDVSTEAAATHTEQAFRGQAEAQLREATTNVERSAAECVALREALRAEVVLIRDAMVGRDPLGKAARALKLCAARIETLLSAPSAADAVLARVREEATAKQVRHDLDDVARLLGVPRDAAFGVMIDRATTEARADERAKVTAPLLARVAMLHDALGVSEPWPVTDMLDNLATAALHLMQDHNCDAHGWEQVAGNIGRVRVAVTKLRAALATSGAESAAFVAGVRRAAQETALDTMRTAIADLVTGEGERLARATLRNIAEHAFIMARDALSLAPAPTKTETK